MSFPPGMGGPHPGGPMPGMGMGGPPVNGMPPNMQQPPPQVSFCHYPAFCIHSCTTLLAFLEFLLCSSCGTFLDNNARTGYALHAHSNAEQVDWATGLSWTVFVLVCMYR
jgi:hypothetical protein